MDWSELGNWPEYLKMFVGLFALAPPSTSIPMFLGLTSNRTPGEQSTIARVAPTAFAIVLLVFVFFGDVILDTFGISLAAFRVAGGILLLLTGLDMMRSPVDEDDEGPSASGSAVSVALVPLAIPFMSGPGAISTAIIFAQQEPGISHRILVGVVVVLLAAVLYGMFRASMRLGSLFSPTAAIVVNRVMGLIITAIAVEFIFHGFADHFPDMTILH